MPDFEIVLSGRKSDVEKCFQALKALENVQAVTSEVKPNIPSIMTRKTNNQFELYEAVVTIALGIASAGAYDGVKAAIKLLAKDKNVSVDVTSEKDPEN
ncbi:hypothetical protein [Planktotalea sp.]|uniref:hypothetical protein n=1 Tax=Planktotalea sp. TaxID=2029877 RepID=UPI003D6A6249